MKAALVGILLFLIHAIANTNDLFACSRCGYAVCRYQYAKQYYTSTPYNYTYNYPDNSFRVTYNINFPQYPAAGNTVFDYTRSQAQLYQNQAALLQPEQFVNAASRHFELGHSSLQQGFSEFNQTAALLFQNQSNILEMQYRADIAREIMKELPRVPVGQSVSYNVTRSANGKITVEAPKAYGGGPTGSANNAMAERVIATMQQACIRCHAPGGEKAAIDSLDLRDLTKLTADNFQSIMFRILTDDPEKVMPPPRTNVVLSAEQKVDFTKLCLSALSQAASKAAAGGGNSGSNGKAEKLPTPATPENSRPENSVPPPPARSPKSGEPKEGLKEITER